MWSLGFDFGSVYAKGALLDEGGRVRHSFYRKRGRGSAVADFLEGVSRLCGGAPFRLGYTGGEGLQTAGTPINSILAVETGIRALHPQIRSIIEVGGQTAKYLLLDEEGGLQDFATNEACAAGTGSFLEQQARRLGLSPAELSILALEADRAATIAGRCSVFAATDMIHLQQKGTPIPEIAYGLCTAIARNCLSSLLKGREVTLPVILAGGCAHNAGILRAFRSILDAPVVVSAFPGL